MRTKVGVLGGGVGGLAAGWMLARTGRYDVTVVERAPFIGGACATFRHGDFLLDYGAHKSYSAIPGILDELRGLMGDEFLQHEKSNAIYLFDTFLTYPIRVTELARAMPVSDLVASGVSAVAAIIGRNGTGPASYEQYIVQRFGRRLYDLVFEPLADKIWGDPSTLSSDIARSRIPSAGFFDTAMRALGLKQESALTDARHFYYPRRGFGRIPARMEEEIVRAGGQVLTSAAPVAVRRQGSRVVGVNVDIEGRRVALDCDLVVSSIPLDQLVRLLGGGDEPPIRHALDAASRLQYRTTFLVYVLTRAERLTDHHWLFFPGRDLIFGRVFEQKRMSDEMVPAGRTALCCDFTDYEGGPLWSQPDAELARRTVADLEKIGLLDRAAIETTFVKRLPRFYPRYDLHYKETISTLYESLKQYDGLLLTGRIGFYNYNNSDHCVDMARFLAQGLEAGEHTADIWTRLEQRVSAYRIVD